MPKMDSAIPPKISSFFEAIIELLLRPHPNCPHSAARQPAFRAMQQSPSAHQCRRFHPPPARALVPAERRLAGSLNRPAAQTTIAAAKPDLERHKAGRTIAKSPATQIR